MKEIQFDETQLGNIQAIGEILFSGDSDDPRSWNYKRELVRPKIKWWRISAFTVLFFASAAGLYCLLTALSLSPITSVRICFAFMLIVVLFFLKRILICLVRIYQRFAPASLRNKCRFEPSCSQYMILSLEKYGLIKGLSKGIDRLKRCNTDDGGFDYP